MRLLLLLCFLGGVMTANAGDDLSAALDANITVKVGQTARLSDGPSLIFTAVSEDSRCPEGTHCIWAGQAKIELEVDGEKITLVIPGMRNDVEVKAEVGDYEVTCTGLMPYPQSPEPLDRSSYKAELAVSRR